MSFGNDIYKVLLAWFVIVISFLLASVWFEPKSFYLFDLIWRIFIILGTHIEGIRLSFSRKQWLILYSLFFLNLLLIRWLSPQITPVNSIIAAIFAPFAEEMFFRGWIIHSIRGTNKEKVILSSLLFGLYHLKNLFILSPFALIYQVLFAGMIIGPVFAVARIKTNSLFSPIALHGINNTIGLTLTEKFLPFITRRRLPF